MTALRIAAQAALDALVESVDLVQHDYDSDWRHGMPTRAAQLASSLAALNAHKAAIDALRAALAEPEHQGDRLQMLLRRSRVQLRKWAEWYGSADHAARGQLPLPPAGDVELAEDISDALAKTDAAPNLSDPAVQKRLAAQWGYTKGEPQGEPDMRHPKIQRLIGAKAGSLSVEHAKTIGDLSQVIVNTAKVEVDYLRATDQGESLFLKPGALPAPSAEQTPALPNGIVGIRRHICKDE